MTKKIIAVMLSGNKTPYFYTATPEQLVNRNVGDRVVIPNKLTDDGTGPRLSLSIGTYDGINQTGADASTLKPIVQFIDADALRVAHVEMIHLSGVSAGR